MQASISQLQGQVEEMAELVSRSSDAYCLAGTQSLQHLADLQTANAEQAQQVCARIAGCLQCCRHRLTPHADMYTA